MQPVPSVGGSPRRRRLSLKPPRRFLHIAFTLEQYETVTMWAAAADLPRSRYARRQRWRFPFSAPCRRAIGYHSPHARSPASAPSRARRWPPSTQKPCTDSKPPWLSCTRRPINLRRTPSELLRSSLCSQRPIQVRVSRIGWSRSARSERTRLLTLRTSLGDLPHIQTRPVSHPDPAAVSTRRIS
jgi:hypothetical protein